MGLREKYSYAIQTAKDLRMDGSAEERNGKLYFKGKVQAQDQANKIWDAIKTIPSWSQEVVADIQAATQPSASPSSGAQEKTGGATYTVKPGDTLSKIAKQMLGDGNAYMSIFNLNRDQLSDPDKIQPGQVLKIPQTTSH